MANENKNINELVFEDEDPTAELEALDLHHLELPDNVDLESAADTARFDGNDEGHEISASELGSELRSRSETINNLQYDIEQLRSRWMGLETEMRAREELTDELNRQVDNLTQKLDRKNKLLRKRNDSIKALKVEIRQGNDAQHDSQALITELRNGVNRLQGEIDEIDAERLRATIAEQGQRITDLEIDKDALQQLLNQDKTDQYLKLLAEQSGQLVSNASLIRELRDKYERMERYADRIRQQLQKSESVADAAQKTCAHLQQSQAQALDEIQNLHALFDAESAASSRLRQQIENLKAAQADEIRTIRFELGEAQETIAQNESENAELASNLMTTQGFRIELERMLKQADKDSGARIEQLEKENRRLRNEAEELKERLDNKSEAINCLLSELAKKAEKIGSIEQIENVIQDMDERMSNRISERKTPEKDRITRVLIGSIEGQELRFPLFKDRLTIGRAEQNDIQLKAQYISRRHAVLVTEGEVTRVVNWGSKNGVFVNGQPITEHFLKNGDIVGIGTAKFRYEERPKREA